MCTGVLWNTNRLALVAARTMDWPDTTEPIITAFPRGMARRGGDIAGVETFRNGLEWTSRHGSL